MRSIFYLILEVFLLLFVMDIYASDESDAFFVATIDSTKGAKINLYCYETTSNNIKEKPVLLVHGFNSNGEVWRNADNNYVKKLNDNGYDVIVVDMRGNSVDTNGDHKVDAAVVGDSWGYGVKDLGDDVGTALVEGISYLNKNLPERDYKKADIITHSTGALAVTAYSRSLGLISYRHNIDTIIELAPPNNGSTSLIANIKNTLAIIPSVFTQSMAVYEYALELLDNKIWIPGSRMESENLRKELIPDSRFLKSIQDLGPDNSITTFIAMGNEDWVVGDWSPVIEARDDIGYEYFSGLDHFNFCNSQTVCAAILDKLAKGTESVFFSRYKPYRNKRLTAFLSGPGIDHPDDTFDVVSFAKGINISPRALFDLHLRIAGRKNKAYLLKYWEGISAFEKAQEEIESGSSIDDIIVKWQDILAKENKSFHETYIYAQKEYLECPDISVLANGYYNELVKLIIEKVGEPVRLIDHTFNPYIVEEQKVLAIPSGGLSGLSHSVIFKKKLSEFVRNGGTVICFSQQYGYDFNALPGTGIKGYGWQEDASCHSKAAYIENFHQIMSSQTELYPDVKLDGYFTEYPIDSKVLLRRTKNLMPAMIVYNFGKGMVIVASIYSDWGYVNGQASSSEIGLVRDIFRWAKNSEMLPEYKLRENFEKEIQVNKDFDKIEMVLKAEDGTVLDKSISEKLLYKLNIVLEEPGIYFVDYILYNEDSKIIQPETEGFYFCVSKPPEGSVASPDFSFDITTDDENYISGGEVKFTFHIKNNTDKNEIIKYKAKFNHHKIEFNESVEVPQNGSLSFDKKIKLEETDLLMADFYSSENTFLGRAERGVTLFQPQLDISINTDKRQYMAGDTASIKLNLTNNSKPCLDMLAVLDVIDSKDNQIHYNSFEVKIDGSMTLSLNQNFRIPEDASKGIWRLKFRAFFNSKLVGFKTSYFEVPEPLLNVIENIPPVLIGGKENEIGFSLQNPLDIDTPSGSFLAQFFAPDNSLIWQDTKEFGGILPHKEKEIKFTMPIQDSFIIGSYKLVHLVSYAGKEKQGSVGLVFNPCLFFESAKSSFKAGEKLEGDIIIINNTKFEIEKHVFVSIPIFGYSNSRLIKIKSYTKVVVPVSIDIPEDVKSGQYGLTLEVSGIKDLKKAVQFFIEDSNLRIIYSEGVFYLENIGGIATDYILKISLKGQKGGILKEEIFEGHIKGGMRKDIIFGLPQGLVSGEYLLMAECEDKNNLKKVCLEKTIEIKGVDSDLLVELGKNSYIRGEMISARTKIVNKGDKIDNGILDVRVVPAIEIGDLCGVIRDDKQEVVKGALVNGIWTNAEGRYRLKDIEKGRYIVNVSAPGFESVSKNINILPGNNEMDINLTPIKYGNLSVTLENSVGSDLILEPLDVAGSDLAIRYGVTSSGGLFEFKHLPVGTYVLKSQPENISKQIQINEGENIVVDRFEQSPLDEGIVEEPQYIDTQEVEPNNSFETANNIVGSAVNMRNKIYGVGDEDYFRFNIDSPSMLNIEINNVVEGFRPYIIVYDSLKSKVDSTSVPSGEEIKFSLELPKAGYYYLLIKDRYNSFSSLSEYILKFNLKSGVDKYEPNPDFNTASQIAIRNEIAPTIFPKADDDYFVFDIEQKGIFYIKMNTVPQGLRPSLKIYDSSGKLLAQKAGTGGEKIGIEVEIDKPGRYFLLVKDWYSSFSSLEQYSFNSYFIDTLDEYEPNNVKEDARLIDFGKNYFATVSTKGDSDFYKLSIPDAGKVIVYLKDIPQNIRPYMRLYKDLSSPSIYSRGGADGEDLIMEFEVNNPCNYYLQVQDRYNSESSFLRYRMLAIYIPNDLYQSIETKYFQSRVELSNINDEKELSFEIPGIDKEGKYYIEAVLNSLNSQEINRAVEDFYVTEGNVLLKMDVDKRIYRQDEDIEIKTIVTNISNEDLKDIELFLYIDGVEFCRERFDLVREGQREFKNSISKDKSFKLTAKVGDVEVREFIDIELPMLCEEIVVPEVVGKEDFEIKIYVENKSRVKGLCKVLLFRDNVQLNGKDIVVHPLAKGFILFTQNIKEGTDFKIVFEGDIKKEILKKIRFGEKIKVDASSDAIYPEGNINIPIKFINAGEMNAGFSVKYKIKGYSEEERNYFVLKGSVCEDSLIFSLKPGLYHLDYSSDCFSGGFSFEVKKIDDLDVVLNLGKRDGDAIPLEVVVENKGYNDFSGTLGIETEFFKGSMELCIKKGEKETKRIDINVKDIPAGQYSLKALIEKENKIVKSINSFVVVEQADIKLFYLERDDISFVAGDKAKFRFKIKNEGGVNGKAGLGFKFKDLFSQEVAEFLEPGKEKDVAFEFLIPEDMENGLYEAEYTFLGKEYKAGFKIIGAKIDVEASYAEDVFSMRVKNKCALNNLNLVAEVRCGSYENAESFILKEEELLKFKIPNSATQDKIYYGVYFGSGKALYLDSFLIKGEEKPEELGIKIIKAGSDKDKYMDKEIVNLNWKIESKDEYFLQLSADLIGPDSNSIRLIDERIHLDKGMNVLDKRFQLNCAREGLYNVSYRFNKVDEGSSMVGQGAIFFEAGEELNIKLLCNKKEYIEGDTIKCKASIFSSAPLKGQLNIFIDDEIVETQVVDVDGFQEFDFDIKSKSSGRYELYAGLFYNGKKIYSEKEKVFIKAKPKQNHSPILFNIGEQRVSIGEVLEFFVKADDIDGDVIKYSVENLPTGASFNLETNRFYWKPTYKQIGEYFATFIVSDGKAQALERVRIVVSRPVPLPPRVKAIAEPLKGVSPLEVNFNADAIDIDGEIVKYEWDFDGQGVYDFSSFESAKAIFVYTGSGSFPAKLRVTDNEGITNVHTVSINVEKKLEAPVIHLDVSPLKGAAPCKVFFNADCSSSSDICKYEWDFDGDGVFDASSIESGEMIKTYTLAGSYNAEFRITTADGVSSSKKVWIEIIDPKSLTVSAIISDLKGNVPIEINFDAVVNAKNSIQKYQWDFEGDGVFDFTSTESAFVRHFYCEPGVYTPTIRVTDEKNISSEDKKEIRLGILNTEDIKAGRIIASAKKGKAPLEVKFSFSSDSGIKGIEYYWDFDGNGMCELVTSVPEAEFTYNYSGSYLAELEVKDKDNFITFYYEAIYVTGKMDDKKSKISKHPELQKSENVAKNNLVKIELLDKSSLILPAGILKSDDVVSIKKLENHEIKKGISIKDEPSIVPIGEYREYKFENSAHSFNKELVISIPYLDEDNDGIVDGKNIDELTLDAYWYDEKLGEWKVLSDAVLFPKENLVTIKTNHFSIYGLAGIENKIKDIASGEDIDELTKGVAGGSVGGGSNCFIATAVFSTPMAPEVKVLCEFRDKILLKYKAGKKLVELYYFYSPPIAGFIKDKPLLKAIIKPPLKLLVKCIKSILY